jgi:hypothetical protein
MKNNFEKGREYERLYSSKRFHLFFGWSCTVAGIIFIIPKLLFVNYSFISVPITLIILGGLSLYLGYSERKELKEIK